MTIFHLLITTMPSSLGTASWAAVILILCLSTFGLAITAVAILSVFFFILGVLTLLYFEQSKDLEDYFEKMSYEYPARLLEAADILKRPKSQMKVDKRLTGSQVIDEQLQEILDFIFRDYVYPWYDHISDNEEVPHEIRIAVQKVIVAFSNRVKEVDWIPFLTTTVVDDAASHLRLYRQAKDSLASVPSTSKMTLEDAFFDKEVAMENKLVCRDHLCTNASSLKGYLQRLCEIVLFYLSPETEFHCLPLRYITRELIVNTVLIPVLTKLSDPDYINQIIIWLCKDMPMLPEVFITVLKVTDNVDELIATKEILNKEISSLRSRDAESENYVKQLLSSLNYLGKLIDTQIARLQSGNDAGPDYSRLLLGSPRLFQLPLDALLKNNVALNHFVDYMRSINQEPYIFFHLNVEGWKASTEQQLTDLAGQNSSFDKTEVLLAEHYSASRQTLERIREAAYSIFEQYLTEQSTSRLQVDETLVRRLHLKIRTEKPNESWFDEVQSFVLDKMQNDEKCLQGFRLSPGYVKLLSELDLLRDDSVMLDLDDADSLDRGSLNSDTASLPEYLISQSGGSGEEANGSPSPSVDSSGPSKPGGPFALNAEITETGLIREKGKTFGVYVVSVSKKYENGHRENWDIYRRYSDFYELHQKIKDKFPELGKSLYFPGKKTFGNIEKKTLERRMVHLNNYLRSLFTQGLLMAKPGLVPILMDFLGPSDYRQPSNLSNAIDSWFKMSMQVVRTVPDSVMNSVDGMVGNLSKVLQVRTAHPVKEESLKVGASLDTETADNIPMRILLLLMTEVFELKSQWLRRRLVQLLRPIVHTMFGDIVNRRIVDYVSMLTSPSKVASYLTSFKDSFWPNGLQSDKRPQIRDQATKMRTRVAAKVALLSSLSDDIKHILGSETTMTGLMSVFTMLQVTTLNTRFWCVILEHAVLTMYPNAYTALVRLHSKSQRLND